MLWSAIAAGGVALALGVGVILWQVNGPSPASALETAVPTEREIIVQPQSVVQHLDITGTIGAGKAIAIVAPFDGVIREKRVQLGDHVDVGDVLVVMDTSEIASRYRDAQSSYIKAAIAAEALSKWDSSPDVLRARRSLEAAELSLSMLDRQVSELKSLLDQGIVSRNEYEGLFQQRDAQRNTVAGAKDDLTATLMRGNDDNRQLVMLELENAQSRLSDLKQQMAGSKVATAVAGILTRPPINESGDAPLATEPGASVTRGAALFSVADTSTFLVTGSVDEIDINRVKLGQRVSVTSDAFPDHAINGQVVNVSAEAAGAGNSGRPPSFDIRASFVVEDEELRRAIRIGMSARMTIETYSNEAALIVPPTVIIRSEAGPQVKLQRHGQNLLQPILLGTTFPEGIEVVSGLSAGDIVMESQ